MSGFLTWDSAERARTYSSAAAVSRIKFKTETKTDRSLAYGVYENDAATNN